MKFSQLDLSWRWIVWFLLLGFCIFSRNVAFESHEVDIFPVVKGQKAEIGFFRSHSGPLHFNRVSFRYNSKLEMTVTHFGHAYRYVTTEPTDSLSFRAEVYLQPTAARGGQSGGTFGSQPASPILGLGYNYLKFEIVDASPDLQGEKLRITISPEIISLKEGGPGSETQYFIVYLSVIILFLINIYYLMRGLWQKIK